MGSIDDDIKAQRRADQVAFYAEKRKRRLAGRENGRPGAQRRARALRQGWAGGLPGCFGRMKPAAWNERLPGTTGIQRDLTPEEVS